MILKPNNFNGVDTSKEWKREDCQKKLWNGVHREEGNEVDLNLPGRKGLEDLQFYSDPARKLSTNLYDIHHCWVYSE
jgi:hypothetical protein